MLKLITFGFATAVLAMLALVPAAFGGGSRDDRGVLKTGRCSGSTTWKLKSKLDNGRLETEFEVDQNRVGRRWRVTLVQDGRPSSPAFGARPDRAARSSSAVF
jgi:hypothetical protein